jgi:hypothetical protein
VTTPLHLTTAAPPARGSAGWTWALRGFLMLMVCGMVFAIVNLDEITAGYPRFTAKVRALYLTLPVFNLIGLLATFFGRRWGYWLLVWMAIPILAIEAYAFGLELHLLRVPVSVAILTFLAHRAWGGLGSPPS